MNPYYPLIATRAGHRCEYRHAPEAVFNFPFEVGHVIPVALGGSDEVSNLALACRSCNVLKSSFIEGVDPDNQETVPLFHPRQHDWDRHFRVDAERAEVHGLTPTGRATVVRLRLNGVAQRAARREWMRLDLYP